MPHPNDMTREELRELVSDLVFASLDLAQHLAWTEMFIDPSLAKPEFVAEVTADRQTAIEHAREMAYALGSMPYEDRVPRGNVDITFMGATGLEKF